MQATIDETARRRAKQLAYNELHHITPKSVKKADGVALSGGKVVGTEYTPGGLPEPMAAEESPVNLLNADQLQNRVKQLRKQMEAAVKEMDFLRAADLRDRMIEAENLLKAMKS